MNSLAIDTSNQVLGVAVMKDHKVVGKITLNIKRNHSVQLMPAVHHLMEETGIMPADLHEIVVAKGPGSFTGVRIGLSTAKTMAWALDIPVRGVSSLEVLAWNSSVSHQALICPFFDARRGLVYTGLYQWDERSNMTQIEQEKNLLMEEWLKELEKQKKPVVFLSPDLVIHKETIVRIMGETAIFPPEPFHLPDPSLLFFAGDREAEQTVHQLIPNYLRLTEAESNWLKKQQGNG